MKHLERSRRGALDDKAPGMAAKAGAGMDTARPDRSLAQRLGNQGMQRLLNSKLPASGRTHPVIQAKLAVSQPGDVDEQEADRVADQVMRMPDPALVRPGIDPTPIHPRALQRRCGDCEDGLQRRTQGSETETPHSGPDTVAATLRQGGRPLDAATRAYFEPRFGADFSTVRIHTDTHAAESAAAVNALAYTVGRDMVFNSGQYAPHRDSGRRLLAHELAHVVQQGSADVNRGGRGNEIRGIRIQRQIGPPGDRIHGSLLDQYSHDTGLPRDTVTQHDPGYAAWLLSRAFSVDQSTYLGLINSALGMMSGRLVQTETLATTVEPILRAMVSNAVWKNAQGTTSGGGAIQHTVGSTTLHLTLILNDDPSPLQPAGLFSHGASDTDANIQIFIRKNATAEELMETLYHEAMHMVSWLMNRPTPALSLRAVGHSGPSGAAATLDLARSRTQISSVRLWLDTLAQSVNARRAAGARISAVDLDRMARWLVEEINVRVETEVFRQAEETQRLMSTRGPIVYIQPGPNWQINTTMVDRYVFDFSHVFLPADRAGLTATDQQALATLMQILEGIFQSRVRRRFNRTPYLMGRGLPRAPVTWTPPPLTPPPFRPLPLP